jgi:putative membrane protein
MDNFRDHAANERTFLAWLRTGIAVVAFGFVVEKFNLFISSLASANGELGKAVRLDKLSGPLGHLEGFALMAAGIILIALSYVRFVRTKKMIENPEAAIHYSTKSELIVTIVLTLLVAVYCIAILIR